MKVIIEAQHVCRPDLRGIPHYSINLIKALIQRQKNEYALTVFDKNRERGNRKILEERLGNPNVPIFECNDLSYLTAMNSEDTYKYKNYNEYTGAQGDVFHFLHAVRTIPDNLNGKMVATFHDMIVLTHSEILSESVTVQYKLGLKKVKEQRPLIITGSMDSKKDLINIANLDDGSIYVVYHGFDSKNLYVDKDISKISEFNISKPYLLFLAAFNEYKGIGKILEAFSYISKKYPEIKLVLAGALKYADNSILGKIIRHPNRNRIILTDYVTDDQKRVLMSNALAFLFPSIHEGFGLPVLEAMACGCPVITSNTTSLPEVAGDAGILIDPTNIEQLIYETERLINSESLRQELSIKGIERAKIFTWDRTAAETEKVYEIAMERQS